VTQARRTFTRFAASVGLSGSRLEGLRLALSEAVTNAVKHAYRGSDRGQVHVSATVAADELWVLVVDNGCGHQTPAAEPGLGVGLALMASESDGCEVLERAEGGTEARMRFIIAGEDRKPA
jgi:anti-sigma regulatory factor (Ser/Thr protein kinase)